MNTGIVKSKASGLALMGKVLVGVVVLGVGFPQQSFAASADVQFRNYLVGVCSVGAVPPGWDLASLTVLCTSNIFSGVSNPGSSLATNLGTTNASAGAGTRKKKGYRITLDDGGVKKDKGASADSGSWGLLITPQHGKTDRPETSFENGYQSEMAGLVVGLDYRYSDSFVLGFAIGQTKDNAIFMNNAGFLKSRASTATMYGTWLPSDNVSIDGYLGYGKLRLDNQRQFTLNLISGTMSSNTTGQQIMAGLSAGYETDVGRLNFAPSFNLDYIKTTINSYNESGSGNDPNISLLALHYSERKVTSLTSSVGGRLGSAANYDWGVLLPALRLSFVHEFQNNARKISNELILTPGTDFQVETDSPDRNYLNFGVGVVAALNDGAQLFLDYEKRTQDRLLRSWAVSLGGLFEF